MKNKITTTQLSTAGLIHLLVVYIVWSTTYLAIRVTVSPGAGFPPMAMGATRMIAGGLILLSFSVFKGNRIYLSRKELFHTMVTGILLWVGGNGLVMWAEQTFVVIFINVRHNCYLV